MEERYVGPGLKGITGRRTPEWIMNMILNTQEMTQKDPDAQALLEEYLTQMRVIVSQPEARSLLEYFRHYDEKGDIVSPKPISPKGKKENTKSKPKN